MAYNVKALTSVLLEAKRFASYASDVFRIVPNRRLIISQHEDCLFAFAQPKQDKSECSLLSDSFVQGEGKETAHEFLQGFANHKAVCLLDANEENLYNEPKHGSKCIYLAGGIASFAINNNGDTLAVAFCSGMLSFYNIVTEEATIYLTTKREIKTNTKNVTQICFHTSDVYTACGTVDGAVAVYQDASLVKSFHHQKGAISVMRFFPRSMLLLAASQYGDIVMYCMQSKAPIATFQDHLSYVNDIAFLITDDNSHAGFVSCARDSTVCFWSLGMTQKDIKKAVAANHVIVKKPFKRLMQFETVVAVSIVTSGLKRQGTAPWALFVATESGVLKYIDPITEKTIFERRTAYGQGDEVKSVTLSNSSNEIIVLGSSGTLCFYSLNLELKHQFLTNIDGAFQFQLYHGNNPPQDIGSETSNDGSELHDNVASEHISGAEYTKESIQHATRDSMEVLDKASSKAINLPKDAMDVDDTTGHLSPAAMDATAETDDIRNESCTRMDTCRSDWVYSMEWLRRQISQGVQLVFILCGDDAIRLMAMDGMGSCITLGISNEQYRHSDTVLSMAYSSTANILASGGKDESVLIWNMRTLTVVTTVKLEGLNVACIALPNEINSECAQFRMLATGDNVLKSFNIPVSWDRASEMEVTFEDANKVQPASITTATATAIRHKKPINAVAFSPNNKVVASVGSDKIVVIYAAENLIVKGECVGHRRSVVSVAFTRINKTAISSSVDATIKIWNLNDFSCIKTLQGHTKAVMKVLVLPSDLQLLSVGMDGLLKIWNIKTSDCIFTADNHYDKVWSADILGSNVLTISGNGIMIWWDDVSADVEVKKMLEEREEEVKRTQVESLAADGKYSEALCLSMELRKPSMASKILKRRCTTQLFRIEKDNGIDQDIFSAWVSHIRTLPDTKKMLTIAFDFVHLWISKSSTGWMANCLLAELLRQFSPTELFVVEGMAQRIDSLLSHQSSHLTRFINLTEKSHLLDILVGFKVDGKSHKPQPVLSYDVLYK